MDRLGDKVHMKDQHSMDLTIMRPAETVEIVFDQAKAKSLVEEAVKSKVQKYMGCGPVPDICKPNSSGALVDVDVGASTELFVLVRVRQEAE